MHGRSTTAGHRSQAAAAAERLGLRYVADSSSGWSRRRHGRGFSYRDARGNPIREPAALARIRRLAIPPAWTDVWICPMASGHLQATGRDARGRKQYRYHSLWTERRRTDNLDRMAGFAQALPRIRQRCARDLRRPGLARDTVLAAAVRLLDLGHIRVGNDRYARLNRSYGLASLRDRHVRVDRDSLVLTFRGKSGRAHEVRIRGRRLATVVSQCRDLPGPHLLQYVDQDGIVRRVTADDVNAYLRDAAGGPFTAKDFRTWAATAAAFRALAADGPSHGRDDRRRVARAVQRAADELGNTAAVVRASYVHPAVLDASTDGPPERTDGPVERVVADLIRRDRRSRKVAESRPDASSGTDATRKPRP